MRARQSVSHPIRIFQWPIKDTLLILSKLHNLENDKILKISEIKFQKYEQYLTAIYDRKRPWMTTRNHKYDQKKI